MVKRCGCAGDCSCTFRGGRGIAVVGSEIQITSDAHGYLLGKRTGTSEMLVTGSGTSDSPLTLAMSVLSSTTTTPLKVSTFLANGSWTPTVSTKIVQVIAVGGGEGGWSGWSAPSQAGSGGGAGGEGGGWSSGFFFLGSLTGAAVSVGQGGTGGIASTGPPYNRRGNPGTRSYARFSGPGVPVSTAPMLVAGGGGSTDKNTGINWGQAAPTNAFGVPLSTGDFRWNRPSGGAGGSGGFFNNPVIAARAGGYHYTYDGTNSDTTKKLHVAGDGGAGGPAASVLYGRGYNGRPGEFPGGGGGGGGSNGGYSGVTSLGGNGGSGRDGIVWIIEF